MYTKKLKLDQYKNSFFIIEHFIFTTNKSYVDNFIPRNSVLTLLNYNNYDHVNYNTI